MLGRGFLGSAGGDQSWGMGSNLSVLKGPLTFGLAVELRVPGLSQTSLPAPRRPRCTHTGAMAEEAISFRSPPAGGARPCGFWKEGAQVEENRFSCCASHFALEVISAR